MFEPSQFALLTTALATSLLHTLIPDHWLPFVLIGRARRWSVGRTALISGFSGLVHTLGSLMLGGIAWLIGIGAADALGETMERASLWLLIGFGGPVAAYSFGIPEEVDFGVTVPGSVPGSLAQAETIQQSVDPSAA